TRRRRRKEPAAETFGGPRQYPYRQKKAAGEAFTYAAMIRKTGFKGKTTMRLFYLAALLLGFSASFVRGQWQSQTIQTDADFRGLSVVNGQVAWASGTKGTYGRTTDGGKTWSVGS